MFRPMPSSSKKVRFSDVVTVVTVPLEDRRGHWISDAYHFKRRCIIMEQLISDILHRKQEFILDYNKII